MVDQGDSPQGGHELNFGSTPQDPSTPPPGAPEPPAVPGALDVPDAPATPDVPSYGADQGMSPRSPDPYPGQSGAYPGQPGAYPGQPGAYPGQPGAYPGQPGAYPGQPGTAPGGPAGPTKTSKGLIWGLVGGGAVVLIAVVLVVALLVVPAITRSSVTASDAVKSYLTAVSRGDAKEALRYVEGATDKALLTDAVLKQSNKLAPIQRISVTSAGQTSNTGTVRATYELGDRTVTTTYSAYRAKGQWKVGQAVIPVSFDTLKGLDATVNGVSVQDLSDAFVFPGTYKIELASTYFSLDGDSTLPITGSDDASALYDLRASLNDSGVTAYRSLVRSAVEACVAMKTLATPCGMDITAINLSGAAPVEGAVTRTLTAEGSAALDAIEPESSGSVPTVVSSYDSIDVDMSLQGSDGNTYTVLFGGSLARPTVDFGAADPQVVWE